MKPATTILALGAAWLAVLAGCAATVHPPLSPRDPVEVYVVDYGIHAALVLPLAEGGLGEFAYGDWRWFALDREEWWRVGPVLFWPTPAGLGVRTLTGPAADGSVAARTWGAPHLALPVERSRAIDLSADLRRYVALRSAEAVQNTRFGLTFVPDPEPYWIGHHCNTVVADWLRRLGCEVSHAPLWADFRLGQPPASPGPDP